ncbi:dihydrodipicolinate synthase family protein [Streptomyces sp. NPDC053048]|uniref:dihydrodipicolinate synthase family protein n=1 Tax=Streptomyces sp. NPDC053048 TaxID=3365694 RepID=UPI0037D269CE
MALNRLEGIIAYPVTPFDRRTGEVDTATLGTLIEHLIDAGVHAVAPLGSTGESAYLSDDEWCEVAEYTVKTVARRVPTVVGISDLTTRGAVRRARFAEQAGADALMVLPMSYWKLGEREVTEHFAAVADAVGIPVMVYNNPATSGVDLSPELIVSLWRRIENVTMVKESTGDIGRMRRIHELSEGGLPFYNGSNPLALEAFAAGAAGWCTAAPCLAPDAVMAFHQAVHAGDDATARTLFERLAPLLRFVVEGGLPRTVKAGLALRGLDAGEPRRPLLPLGPEEAGRLARLLEADPGA